VAVNYFDFFGSRCRPDETDPPLVIYPDTVLADPVTFQWFQTISGWNSKVIEMSRDLQLSQLTPRDDCNIDKSLDPIAPCKFFRVRTPERSDHSQ